MISSPTEESVIMIGGLINVMDQKQISSSDILELSGHSEETLNWKILEQKLQYPRNGHTSFFISDDIADTLTFGFSLNFGI